MTPRSSERTSRFARPTWASASRGSNNADREVRRRDDVGDARLAAGRGLRHRQRGGEVALGDEAELPRREGVAATGDEDRARSFDDGEAGRPVGERPEGGGRKAPPGATQRA